MKTLYLLLIILSVFSHRLACAQSAPRYTISGYVRDAKTSESLIGASVYNAENRLGTASNQYGFYSLTLPAGEITLTYSYIGYVKEKRTFLLDADTVIHMGFTEGATNLEAVTVSASGTHNATQMSTISLSMKQIKKIPALAGEVDLMKAIQLLPGVQSGGEGGSGLYVRGGGPDQNLILLDGIQLYNVSHLFGFFSIFNADAVNSMDVIKGGFPARYGGRISSVVDISLKEGNMNEFHGEGAIGLISSKLTFEGPVWKDRTAFIVSARRTYIDILMFPYIRIESQNDSQSDYSLGYHFYDVTAKINHKISDNDRIYLSAYMGNDRYYSEEEFTRRGAYLTESSLKWGNMAAMFRWNHIFTNRLFANTAVTYNKYRMITSMENTWNMDTDPSYHATEYNSELQDWAWKTDFYYKPFARHTIRMGAHVLYHTYIPSVISQIDNSAVTNFDNSRYYNFEYGVYAEDDLNISEKVKLNAGFHWSGFDAGGKFYQLLQPRLSACYFINEHLSVKASYSLMNQYIHLLTSTSIGLPLDLWVPSTQKLRPQKSNQFAAGVTQSFGNKYEISVESYYKTMDNVIEYKDGASFFDTNSTWEEKVLQGEGSSYGVELFLQKKKGSFTGWLGYTLSWTDRRFDGINHGKRFWYKYDRRHDVSLVLTRQINEHIELSATWVYGSGNNTTIPVGVFSVSNPVSGSAGYGSRYYDYGERNGYRMKAYHRLDISASFAKKTKWGERIWIVGLYNAYSRRNPFYIDIIEKEAEISGKASKKYVYTQYSLFPVIPAISYAFKF